MVGVYWMRITSRHAHTSLKLAVLVLSSLFISLIYHKNFIVRKKNSPSSLSNPTITLIFFFCLRNEKESLNKIYLLNRNIPNFRYIFNYVSW